MTRIAIRDRSRDEEVEEEARIIERSCVANRNIKYLPRPPFVDIMIILCYPGMRESFFFPRHQPPPL